MRKNSISLKSRGATRQPEKVRPLDYYFPVRAKSEIIEQKLVRKQSERKRRNEQTLITEWLFRGQDRSNEDHLLLKVDKPVMLMIFQFLTLTDSAKASLACRYLHRCYNSIWLSLDYFEQFDLGNFSAVELKKIMEKSAKLSHIRTVKRLLTGKNLQHYTDKIRLKAVASQLTGQLLSFEIEPKRPNMGVFLMDDNILEMAGQSYQSLRSVSLINCHFLTGKSLIGISKCRKLQGFSITRNSLVEDQHIEALAAGCRLLTYLNIAGCNSLTEACFRTIASLQLLKTLILSGFEGTMSTLWTLGALALLELNLSNSTVNNSELSQLLKYNSIANLNVSGCMLLSMGALETLVGMEACSMRTLNVNKLALSEQQVFLLASRTSLQSITASASSPRILERLIGNRSPSNSPAAKCVC